MNINVVGVDRLWDLGYFSNAKGQEVKTTRKCFEMAGKT